MIMSVVFTIFIQWRPASCETSTGSLRINLAGFDLPKVRKKKIFCLYKKVKVHSTRTSRPLRFSELGKQRASKNSVYLTREACSKIMIFAVCKVSKSS